MELTKGMIYNKYRDTKEYYSEYPDKESLINSHEWILDNLTDKYFELNSKDLEFINQIETELKELKKLDTKTPYYNKETNRWEEE